MRKFKKYSKIVCAYILIVENILKIYINKNTSLKTEYDKIIRFKNNKGTNLYDNISTLDEEILKNATSQEELTYDISEFKSTNKMTR